MHLLVQSESCEIDEISDLLGAARAGECCIVPEVGLRLALMISVSSTLTHNTTCAQLLGCYGYQGLCGRATRERCERGVTQPELMHMAYRNLQILWG